MTKRVNNAHCRRGPAILLRYRDELTGPRDVDGQMDQDLFEACRALFARARARGKSSGNSKTGARVRPRKPREIRQLRRRLSRGMHSVDRQM